jgi:phage terminase small subunit
VKEIRRAKKKWFFITIEDISDNFDIFLSDTYGLEKFDLVIVSWWKKNRIQISKIVKTSREKLKELAWGSYDEKDTVSAVKKARAGEQQQLNIERIKAEIAEQNEKIAEENKENLTKNISSEENEVVEDIESENAEVDEELNEIEEESIDEDISEEEIVEDEREDIEKEDDEQPLSPLNSSEKNSEDIENISSLWGEGNHASGGEVVEPENNSVTDKNQTFTITSENLPFSKMKQLMTIVSWNPWDITIQVLWNEMKVSEKWLNELKKLIQE